MELGLSSYTYPWAVGISGFMPEKPMNIPELIQKANSFGLNRLQICDNISFETLPHLEDLPKGFQMEIGTRRLEKTNLLKYLAICKKYNSPFLRIVIDDADFHPSENEVIDIIHSVIHNFKEANIILAIENHDRFTVQSLVNIISKTDKNYVGICLDTANSLGAGEGINEVVKGLAPYTVNLHIKDFTINRLSHKMGFLVEGYMAGKGMLDIPFILSELAKYNRCVSATLEVWSNLESTIEQTIEKEEKWVIESIKYLQKL